MPKGIYPRTKKHKINWFKKGHPFYGDLNKSNYFQKGHTPWHKGTKGLIKVTKKTCKKMSKSQKKRFQTCPSHMKGKKHSLITHIRMRISARRGNKNNRWKGGIYPLVMMIRDLPEMNNWRIKVFERDDYTCQICNKKGGYFEAHHKKLLYKILKIFLQKYNQFSPIEDKETLIRLAIVYKPFWNINNGQTLCLACHQLTKKKTINKNEWEKKPMRWTNNPVPRMGDFGEGK